MFKDMRVISRRKNNILKSKQEYALIFRYYVHVINEAVIMRTWTGVPVIIIRALVSILVMALYVKDNVVLRRCAEKQIISTTQ